MKVPRYYFVVRAWDHTRDDPDGIELAGPKTAREHGHRVVRELKAEGRDTPDSVLQVLDESGKIIHVIPF